MLVGCVVGYVVLTFLLGRWELERVGVLVETHKKDGNRLQVVSDVHVTENGDCEYELSVENLEIKGSKASWKLSITDFVDAEGRFYKNLFSNKANELFSRILIANAKKAQ